MVVSKIKEKARETLTGKWGKSAIIILVCGIIEFLLSLILGLISAIPFIGIVGVILNLLITLPLSYGLIGAFVKMKRGEEISYTEPITLGLASIKRTWFVFGNIFLKILPVIIILIIAIIVFSFALTASVVPTRDFMNTYSASSISAMTPIAVIAMLVMIGCYIYLIPKGLLYVLSYIISYDKPDSTAKEVVEDSANLMKGHRWSYVWLNITFIGWAFLSAFTFGIGTLFLIPYMTVSSICFYDELNSSSNTKADDNQKVEEGPIKEN